MGGEYFPLLMFVGVIIGILAGFPVAFSLLGIALIFGISGFGDAVSAMLIRRILNVAMNYVLAAVPFFVFMGVMLERSGVAERLFEAVQMWVGRLKGGLAISTIIMCTIFAAATGIIGASVVIIGLLALPAMLKHKYQKELALGCIIAGGSLGTIIPPSVVTVVYGPIAGLSVGRLLMATIMPGFLLAAIYLIYVALRCQMKPELGPPVILEHHKSIKEKLVISAGALVPPIVLVVAVLGSIIAGLAAPTEAAALGAFGSTMLCIAYRKLNWKVLKEVVFETIKLTSMIMLVLAAGTAYSGVFLGLGGGRLLESIMLGWNVGPWGLLIIFMFIIFIAGFLLDWISVLLIFVPVFTPIVVKLGFNPIWFSVLVIMMIQTSYLTPPMAPGIFYIKGICPPEIKDPHLFRSVIPFVVLQLVGIVLVMIFPEIVLWLPEKIIGY
ncbi:MAG: TRAP transporter large permease subunit [Bacillota bacterium]